MEDSTVLKMLMNIKGEKMRNAIRHIILLFALLYFTAGCHACYPDINGTVVDAETGQPIEGAIVLVEWTKRVGFGDYHTESVKVVEVITDKDGKFKVTGIKNPLVDPPDMTIYKKGYVAWNNKIIFPEYSKRDFKWQSGNLFRLDRFKEDYSYDKHVSFLRRTIGTSLNLESKKIIYNAFEWEDDLAQKERSKKGISP